MEGIAMQEKRLEVFLAVAMSGNLAKAAAILNLAPSSVSKELKSLEEEIGALLVDRQKGVKTTRLTPSGEVFLPLALKWQELNKDIFNALRKEHTHFLSVAACESANNNLLPAVYKALINHSPPVHLKIITDPTDMLYEKVETRDIDVAFVVHQEASKLVRATPIYKDKMVVAIFEDAGDESDDDEIGTLTPSELQSENELYIEWSGDYRLWHQSVWDPLRPVAVEFITTYLVPCMLDTEGRWAIVPSCVKKDFKNINSGVRFYKLNPEPPDLVFYMLTHRMPKYSALGGLDTLKEVLGDAKIFNLG
jgi:DNA-binding transcriptional LysR family regulator